MSLNLPDVDPAKSYIVSGETLNALTRLANQWANLQVVMGDKLSLVYGDNNAVLTLPSVPDGYEEAYYNLLVCDGGSCASGIFLVKTGSEGS